jgi:hypothetical protein
MSTKPGAGQLAWIAVQNFAEFVNHFRFDPLAPARKCFTCGSGGTILFPSSTHRSYLKRIGPFNLRFYHDVDYRSDESWGRRSFHISAS